MLTATDWPLSGTPGFAFTRPASDPVLDLFRDREASNREPLLKDNAPDRDYPGRGYSLESMQQRINAVRQEIAQVRSSPYSPEVKARLLEAARNELSLLQAGQYSFARAGLSVRV